MKNEKKISFDLPVTTFNDLVNISRESNLNRSQILRIALNEQLHKMTRAHQVQQREAEPAEMYFL